MDNIKRILEDPTHGIQALAARHARLFLHTNIWQRPSSWLQSIRECPYWYALCLYGRFVRRYQLQSPLASETDPMWEACDPVKTAEEWRACKLYMASFEQELENYLLKYLFAHATQWKSHLEAVAVAPVGKKISVHGTCFAYVCAGCEHRVIISRLFETQPMTQVQAALEHAYCYCCFKGLDGSGPNVEAYHVHPTEDAQIMPSAFSLLSVGLACEALTQPLTVERVHYQLLRDGMNWSKSSIQTALHTIFPDVIEPVFPVENADELTTLRCFEGFSIQVGDEVARYSYGIWETTIVAEINRKHQRLRCLSEEGMQRHDQAQTAEERQRLLTDHTLSFWYNSQGQVLSEATGKPLKRKTPEINIWMAGKIYPLTSEVRAIMRMSAKRRRLDLFMHQRLPWALQKNWKREIDEARLDFLLDWLEKGLVKMIEQFGENSVERWTTRSSD